MTGKSSWLIAASFWAATTTGFAQDTTTIPGVVLDAKVMRGTAIGDIIALSMRVEVAKTGPFSAIGYTCQQLDAKGEVVSKSSGAIFAPAFETVQAGWLRAEQNNSLPAGVSKVACKLGGLAK